MPDRNSLLLPSPAQCAPDAAAALLPGPDVAAVCASGLRRGLLLPVDLVALRESWRAEARAGARPAPRPRRLVHDRHTRGLLHAGSMRARAGACTGTEQGADAAAPGPGFPPAVDDRQATQHVSQVSLHSLWCFARAREDASCKAKLRLVQQGCQAPGLHQAEHRHEAARFQCPIICDMQASPGAPPCSPAPDQAAGSPRQCEDCAAAGDPPSSGGAALGAAGSQAASPQDTCMDPGTFAPPSHGPACTWEDPCPLLFDDGNDADARSSPAATQAAAQPGAADCASGDACCIVYCNEDDAEAEQAWAEANAGPACAEERGQKGGPSCKLSHCWCVCSVT